MSNELDPRQIELFLKNNLDFFMDREDMLADLRIPHSSGKAVSLVEKQMSILRERNTELRHRLGDLIDNARENDKLFGHTRRLILTLLDCKNLSQAVDAIYSSFKNDFGIEKTQLILFNDNSISRARNESLSQAQIHIGKYLKARQTIGGGIGEQERQFLFKEDAPQVQSAALAVLAYGDVYGVLAIGNQSSNYYESSKGTLFLSYIAEVLSRALRDFIQTNQLK